LKLKNTLKTLKLNESMISMILGAVVIIVAGILIINYFSNKRSEAAPPLLVGDELTLPIVHIVGEGEDLWSISEKYYGTGYNWTYVAEENGITNPNLIEKGQEIIIPLIEEEEGLTEDVITQEEVEIEVTPNLGPATQAEGKSTHTISKGEDLWKIAEKYYDSGYNWVDIAKTNNIKDANHIEVGDLIIIPAVEAKKSTVLGVKHTDAISGATYTVVQGDSLWGISVRAFGDGYKWVEIAEENGLQNPDIIHSGNILTLPR
jgi:putative chitinase